MIISALLRAPNPVDGRRAGRTTESRGRGSKDAFLRSGFQRLCAYTARQQLGLVREGTTRPQRATNSTWRSSGSQAVHIAPLLVNQVALGDVGTGRRVTQFHAVARWRATGKPALRTPVR
jgi:hypothetical protein